MKEKEGEEKQTGYSKGDQARRDLLKSTQKSRGGCGLEPLKPVLLSHNQPQFSFLQRNERFPIKTSQWHFVQVLNTRRREHTLYRLKTHQ